ncbi:MAG: hypothetical protein S4CHLAM20_00690 [Chlamydiia bacterium]|nr:hypothetical protein [Chlamydiia bacterium]
MADDIDYQGLLSVIKSVLPVGSSAEEFSYALNASMSYLYDNTLTQSEIEEVGQAIIDTFSLESTTDSYVQDDLKQLIAENIIESYTRLHTYIDYPFGSVVDILLSPDLVLEMADDLNVVFNNELSTDYYSTYDSIDAILSVPATLLNNDVYAWSSSDIAIFWIKLLDILYADSVDASVISSLTSLFLAYMKIYKDINYNESMTVSLRRTYMSLTTDYIVDAILNDYNDNATSREVDSWIINYTADETIYTDGITGSEFYDIMIKVYYDLSDYIDENGITNDYLSIIISESNAYLSNYYEDEGTDPEYGPVLSFPDALETDVTTSFGLMVLSLSVITADDIRTQINDVLSQSTFDTLNAADVIATISDTLESSSYGLSDLYAMIDTMTAYINNLGDTDLASAFSEQLFINLTNLYGSALESVLTTTLSYDDIISPWIVDTLIPSLSGYGFTDDMIEYISNLTDTLFSLNGMADSDVSALNFVQCAFEILEFMSDAFGDIIDLNSVALEFSDVFTLYSESSSSTSTTSDSTSDTDDDNAATIGVGVAAGVVVAAVVGGLIGYYSQWAAADAAAAEALEGAVEGVGEVISELAEGEPSLEVDSEPPAEPETDTDLDIEESEEELEDESEDESEDDSEDAIDEEETETNETEEFEDPAEDELTTRAESVMPDAATEAAQAAQEAAQAAQEALEAASEAAEAAEEALQGLESAVADIEAAASESSETIEALEEVAAKAAEVAESAAEAAEAAAEAATEAVQAAEAAAEIAQTAVSGLQSTITSVSSTISTVAKVTFGVVELGLDIVIESGVTANKIKEYQDQFLDDDEDDIEITDDNSSNEES